MECGEDVITVTVKVKNRNTMSEKNHAMIYYILNILAIVWHSYMISLEVNWSSPSFRTILNISFLIVSLINILNAKG